MGVALSAAAPQIRPHQARPAQVRVHGPGADRADRRRSRQPRTVPPHRRRGGLRRLPASHGHTIMINLLLAVALAADFQLVILKPSFSDLKLGNEGEHAQSVLKDADTSRPWAVIGKDDIDSYDWDKQTITLTRAGTRRLTDAIGSKSPLPTALNLHPFVVRAGGEFKYGGVFLFRESQATIRYPVARVTVTGGQASFALLPVQIPYVGVDPVGADGT